MEEQSFQARMKIQNPKLMQLYSFPTPNGVKVAAALEEIIELKTRTGKSDTLREVTNVNTVGVGVAEEERVVLYEPHAVNIRSGENRLKWYCQLGFQNHKIPGLIDPECCCSCPETCITTSTCSSSDTTGTGTTCTEPIIRAADGTCKCKVALFESGSILTYLSNKYDELMPKDNCMRAKVVNWLFFGSTAVSVHFKLFGFYYKYCSHGIPYCVERYTKEVHRELTQMEYQLRHSKHWFIGDMYTVADISMWPWVHQLFVNYDNAGEVVFDIATLYPLVFAWYKRCLARPASKRALEVCALQFDT